MSIKRLLIIFLVALLARGVILAAVWNHPQRMIHPDTMSYLRLAVNLLEGRGFSQKVSYPFTPDFLRTPLYPAFISALYKTFGQNTLVVSVVQVFLSSVTVVLLYVLGRRLMEEKTAFWGSILYAISLVSIVYSVLILTETLFTLLFLLSFILIQIYKEKSKAIWLICGGIVMGLAALCRPIALLGPILILILLWLVHQDEIKQFLRASLLYLLSFSLVLMPWVVRNYALTGKAYFSNISYVNLIYYNAVSIDAELRGISQTQSREEISEKISREIETRGWEDNELLRNTLYREMGLQIILANPIRYTIVHLINDLNSLLPAVTDLYELLGITQGGKGTLSVINQLGLLAGIKHYFGDKVWLLVTALPFLLLLIMMYFLFVVGVIVLIKKEEWFSFTILLIPILYLLIIPGAPSLPRFRVPVMPYMCLLAGLGATAVANCLQGWRRLNKL